MQTIDLEELELFQQALQDREVRQKFVLIIQLSEVQEGDRDIFGRSSVLSSHKFLSYCGRQSFVLDTVETFKQVGHGHVNLLGGVEVLLDAVD